MIRQDEWKDAMALCWRVFLEFEGDLYAEEGKTSFYRFINDEHLYLAFRNGGYPVCAAFFGNTMIGVAAVRSGPHLSLLFVEGFFQGSGVGRTLIEYMNNYLSTQIPGLKSMKLTVNASPVAVGFYEHLGFVSTDSQKQKDGILYTPMEITFQEWYNNCHERGVL